MAMGKSNYVIGLRSVEQLINNQNIKIKKVFAEYHSKNKRLNSIINHANTFDIPIHSANRARLDQICGESSHQGVIAEISRNLISNESELRSMIERRLSNPQSEPFLLLMLERVKDPHNLGACIRTAEAAGVDALIISQRDSASLTPAAIKVASGAAEQIPLIRVKHLGKVLLWLGEYGVMRIGTSDKANESIFEVGCKESCILVMGQEHSGISKMIKDRCDKLAHIPMQGSVSSLNVSVAAGICLFEIVRSRISM